ncbi:hypothetical protein HMPREF1986_01350 [Oribacterium sp. oral taxon 078 str. F0263]|nr:hypothetical protein HMPREF1986_01350 [Oribacterium sp. oral taxon 078 str. F0263]
MESRLSEKNRPSFAPGSGERSDFSGSLMRLGAGEDRAKEINRRRGRRGLRRREARIKGRRRPRAREVQRGKEPEQ